MRNRNGKKIRNLQRMSSTTSSCRVGLERDLVAVLLEDGQLVLELLAGLQSHREHEKHVIDPGNNAFCLVSVKSGHTFVYNHVVNSENKLPRLKVKTHSYFSR